MHVQSMYFTVIKKYLNSTYAMDNVNSISDESLQMARKLNSNVYAWDTEGGNKL